VEELNEQQTAVLHRHQMSIYGLIGLLFLAFIGYIFYRRHHHYQLHLAHKELRKD
jgi:LPXTG-motif cell wall-anchored protein